MKHIWMRCVWICKSLSTCECDMNESVSHWAHVNAMCMNLWAIGHVWMSCVWKRVTWTCVTWVCVTRMYLYCVIQTGWRRPIGCVKLQVIFRKRATNHRALWWKMTYKDKASYGSLPPCMNALFHAREYVVWHTHTHTDASCHSIISTHMNASCHAHEHVVWHV